MKRRQILIAALGLPVLPLRARAGGAHYSARLIDGGMQHGLWRTGFDLRLGDGWKTYWRMPGDSGVPPQFDWSRSENIRAVDVLWPAPRRFSDAGGETVGYKGRVVFPLDVEIADMGKPTVLALDAFFGVCETVCIPAKYASSLKPAATTPPDVALIASFAALVPHRADAGSPLHVTRAQVVEVDGKPLLALTLGGRGFSADLDIFVEGSGFAYFRAPRPVDGTPTVHLPIDGLKDRASLVGRRLTLTMVSDDIRLEQEVVVD